MSTHDVADFGAAGLCEADGDEGSGQGIALLPTIVCAHHTGSRSVIQCTLDHSRGS